MTLLNEIQNRMPSIETLTQFFHNPLKSADWPAVESLVGDNNRWTYKRYYVPSDEADLFDPRNTRSRILLEIKKFTNEKEANDWLYDNFKLATVVSVDPENITVDYSYSIKGKWYRMPFLRYEIPELADFKDRSFIGTEEEITMVVFIDSLRGTDVRNFVGNPDDYTVDVDGLTMYASIQRFTDGVLRGTYSDNGSQKNINVCINVVDVIQCGNFVGITLDYNPGFLCNEGVHFEQFRAASMFSSGYYSAYSTPFSDTPNPVYGCTDPDADNYNPDATIDNGSCEYVIEDYSESSFAEIINPLMIMMMGIMMIGIMVNMVRDQNKPTEYKYGGYEY